MNFIEKQTESDFATIAGLELRGRLIAFSNIFGLIMLLAIVNIASNPTLAQKSSSKSKSKDAARAIATKQTKVFEYKEGFERRPKDIINTLKDNEVSRFQTMLEGLDQAYDLDNTLKGKGPWTLFAPSDKAFKKIPYEDLQSLFANKKKLKQVLSYHMVKGKFKLEDLRKKTSLKTVEGHSVKVSNRFGNIFMDDSFLSTADVPCSNGVIHVIDRVIMPPLSK